MAQFELEISEVVFQANTYTLVNIGRQLGVDVPVQHLEHDLVGDAGLCHDSKNLQRKFFGKTQNYGLSAGQPTLASCSVESDWHLFHSPSNIFLFFSKSHRF